MHKTIKILICLFIIYSFFIFFQHSFAKYIIEDIITVAKLDIDRCKPIIELSNITASNIKYPNYANKSHLITGYIKVIEKNIVKISLSKDNIKILVNNNYVTPNFIKFNLISEEANEKIYEFSFTNTIGNGYLSIEIPEGIIEDKSGLINDKKVFSTNIIIDNAALVANF